MGDVAIAPTDPNTSLSRLGSIAPDALVMPLPAMRITMPELPTYGGPAVNVSVAPPPKQSVLSGKVLAVVLLTLVLLEALLAINNIVTATIALALVALVVIVAVDSGDGLGLAALEAEDDPRGARRRQRGTRRSAGPSRSASFVHS